jgi:hypothetical protein
MAYVDAPLRTDDDFLSYHTNEFSIDEHVKDVENPSPFVKMGFNMVTGFVIDSMHTMISGAFFRKLDGFASNPLEGKLSSTQLAQVEKRLKFYRHCHPYEFDRYVGSFSQCGKYKGHVLRQFLYYLLYPVFDGIVEEDELEYIMLLQYAMMLLGAYKTSTKINPSDIKKAEVILKRYSSELTYLGIPCRFVSHQIIHLHEGLTNFQNPVEANSAFEFESFLSFFRRIIRNGFLLPEQIRNRLVEKSKYQLPTTSCGLIIDNKIKLDLEASKRFSSSDDDSPKYWNHGDKWPKKLIFKNYSLSNIFPNNVCLIKNRSAVVCTDFEFQNNTLLVVGRKCMNLDCAFRKPYVSTDYFIYRASELSKQKKVWLVSDISAKYYALS